MKNLLNKLYRTTEKTFIAIGSLVLFVWAFLKLPFVAIWKQRKKNK